MLKMLKKGPKGGGITGIPGGITGTREPWITGMTTRPPGLNAIKKGQPHQCS